MHVVINKIINLEKQEVALGNQNVRAVCLRDKLEFKFFFSFLFSQALAVISEQSINFVLFL